MLQQIKDWVNATLGPDVYQALWFMYANVVEPILGEPRLRVSLILSTIAVALVFFLLAARYRGQRSARGFVAFLVPRSVFLHPSAILDYKFYVINQLVMSHLRLGKWVIALAGLFFAAEAGKWLLTLLFGPGPNLGAPSLPMLLVFTLCNLLAWDFGKYLSHYLTHRFPILWEFHKVHHSAEVLMPLTAFRAHPIDIMLDYFFRLLCTGVVGGFFAYFYADPLTELSILGFNAIAFVIYYWIAHLQHSHIPVHYGRYSRLLVSPLMHQVHHSGEVRHWDRNFGFLFGIWDWMFRTIYVPGADEQFRLGLPEGNDQYRTLRAMYLQPFIGAVRILARKKPASSPA
jgi:sterol desaturase/sphingolipid hydroxylase (fatty acid hydroxylase superfamily)